MRKSFVIAFAPLLALALAACSAPPPMWAR
jgi:hypothetical protein